MSGSLTASSRPVRLYRRWWMAGPWENSSARDHQAELAKRADDGHAGDEPLLRTLWAIHPSAFPADVPWVARCRRRHRGGPVPSASCTCGIYGTETLAAALKHGTPVAEHCVGIIEPSGRMFEASPGVWRVESAVLVSLVDTSQRWTPERRAARMRAAIGDQAARVPPGSEAARLLERLMAPAGWSAFDDHGRVLEAVAKHYGVPIETARRLPSPGRPAVLEPARSLPP